jgi:hypothetical protein
MRNLKILLNILNLIFKGEVGNLLVNPEVAGFPVNALKIASWFWKENAYVVLRNERPAKQNLKILADGTFHNFTMLTYALTGKINKLKERGLLYEKAVDALQCVRIKRGRGAECIIGPEEKQEKGYAVPICLIDFKKPYCGCEGTFDPKGFVLILIFFLLCNFNSDKS